MARKQISLCIPETLFKVSKEYTKELGYRNIQECILETLRKKTILDKVERYKQIEEDMKSNPTILTEKQAAVFVKNL